MRTTKPYEPKEFCGNCKLGIQGDKVVKCTASFNKDKLMQKKDWCNSWESRQEELGIFA